MTAGVLRVLEGRLHGGHLLVRVKHEHGPCVLELRCIRHRSLHPLDDLLAVERLQGCFAALDFQLSVVEHEELLSAVKGSLFNFGLETPHRERMECFPEKRLFIVDLD